MEREIQCSKVNVRQIELQEAERTFLRIRLNSILPSLDKIVTI